MSDRLALASAIEDAGIERAKAERVASVIVDMIHDQVATKADLNALEASLLASVAAVRADLQASVAAVRTDLQASVAAVRTDLQASEAAARADLQASVAAVRADMRTETARLDAKIDLVGHQLLTRLGALMIVVVGAAFAALHYWPPHP